MTVERTVQGAWQWQETYQSRSHGMIRELESFTTEAEAQAEGERLRGLLYGYGYRFQVYQSGNVWTLDSTRYRSCD